ncbi:MAG: ATPase [Alphaproteobacteria bacterium]|nr:ATPase [Alphaproteobacteria bacterium]
MIGLGFDGGGTGARWRLVDSAGKVLGQGDTGPFTGHIFDDAEQQARQAAIVQLAAAVKACGRPEKIVAGITGLSAGSDTAALLSSWLAAAFDLAQGSVQVVDDMRIAYRAAFTPGEGVLVYAGTGSVAMHLAEDGSALRAGGHGYLIDDAGGGYWIGRQALSALVRAQDEGRDPGALGQEIGAVIGSLDWEHIRRHVYSGGRAAVAGLVPATAKAALRDDSTANAILSSAGEELARLARVLINRLGRQQPVALAGGVGRASPLIFSHFRTSLPRDAALRQVTQAPVEIAARLAAEGARA